MMKLQKNKFHVITFILILLGVISFVHAEGLRVSNESVQVRIGQKRYNVLFVMVDALRYCSLSHGHYHDPVVKTPNLDRFAKEGVVFKWAYATSPKCTPCRASILSGQFPHQVNSEYNGRLLPQETRCGSHEFNEAGYNCHYIGKWHVDGSMDAHYIQKGWRRRGFTTFLGYDTANDHMHTKTWDNDGNRMQGLDGQYEPTLQTDWAIEFMTEQKDNPFFCFLSWGPPHAVDQEQPPEFLNMYSPDEVVMRPNTTGVTSYDRKELAWYYGHITALDKEFGRLMAKLDELGLTDNTIVVFTSDHGDLHRSHGQDEKSQPEEESSHVPMMMRLPGYTKPGLVVEHGAGSVDLMPTLLSMCGLTIPESFMGSDKSALLRGQSVTEQSVYATGAHEPNWGVVGWRLIFKSGYKLILKVDGNHAMYDLENDPYEMNNLYGNPSHETTQQMLMQEYTMWKQKTDDYFTF